MSTAYDVIACRCHGYIAIMSTHCHADHMGIRPNVTSLGTIETDSTGNEKRASTGSLPTLAIFPVVSPTRRQFHGDVGDHVMTNTNHIRPQLVSYAQSVSSCQMSQDTLLIHQDHHHHHHQQQQYGDKTGRSRSICDQLEIVTRCNRHATVDFDLRHSVKLMTPSRVPPASSSSSSSATITSSSTSSRSRRRAMLGRCVERRRAATERERHRLRRVNSAYDELRERTCHHSVTPRRLPGHRLSKLDILRRAISYIEHLEHLLNNNVHITRVGNGQKTVNVVSKLDLSITWCREATCQNYFGSKFRIQSGFTSLEFTSLWPLTIITARQHSLLCRALY